MRRLRIMSALLGGLALWAPIVAAAEATAVPAAEWERLTAQYTTLYQQQQFAPATEAAQQALQAAEQAFGAADPRVAQVLNDLGRLLAAQDRYEEALTPDAHALQIRRQQIPLQPAAVIQSLRNVARGYMQLKRWSEAEPLLVEAKAILTRELPIDHLHRLDVVADLALLHMEQAQAAAAEPLFAELETQASGLKGLDPAKLAFIWHRYGQCLAQLGRQEEAAHFEQRAATLQALMNTVQATP